KRILVTGATGHIGSQVVAQLRGTGCRVRALSRNPQSANLPRDIEVASGDLAMADTLDACLSGVDAVFLVWLAPLAAAAPALASIASHVERIVLLTSPHRTAHPFFQQPNALRIVHAGVDQLVEASGRQWTILRPGPFAINCRNWWAPQIKSGDVVRWCHADAATAPVHERDVAAVAVRALGDEGHHGREYVRTGPASLTQRQQVEIIGDAIGRPLSFMELSRQSARDMMTAMMSDAVADMLLDAYGAAVDLPAYVTSTIADVTGAFPRSFRQWAVDHADDFRTRSRPPAEPMPGEHAHGAEADDQRAEPDDARAGERRDGAQRDRDLKQRDGVRETAMPNQQMIGLRRFLIPRVLLLAGLLLNLLLL